MGAQTALVTREDIPERYEASTLPFILSGEAMCKLLGYRKSRFYRLVALGLIPDDLRAPLPRGWSRDKVLKWLKTAPPPMTRRRDRPSAAPTPAVRRAGAARAAKR